MKVGFVIPVFARDPAVALAAARYADAAGVDGVFSYDHMFPINLRHLPALSALPMLAAAASQTERVALGTLVSRVTLVPVPLLVEAMVTLQEVANGRAIAGIGTGDRLTEPENKAYGLPFPSVEERLALLTEAARALRAHHVETWVGGRSRAVRAIAATEADAWNAWEAPVDELAAFAAANEGRVAATWGGAPPPPGELAEHLGRLARAGVGWAVYGPPPSIDWEAFARNLGGAAEAVR